VARSILKEPKYYFYDTGQVAGDEGVRLENAVACGLLKYADFLTDTRGSRTALRYFRTKDSRELDFLLVVDDRIRAGFEVKLTDSDRSPSFGYFKDHLKDAQKIQLVYKPDREKTYPDGVEIRRASTYMARLDLA
jgi:predicted AAA+ superfamily ATPase